MRLWLIVPLAAAAFAQDPAQIFKTTCAGCHGLDSMGGEHAPAINLGRPDSEVLQLIQNGIPSSGMPAFGKKLTSEQIQNLITYLRRLQPIDAWLAVEAKLPLDLRPSEGSWTSYNGDYTGRRYSSLNQITPEQYFSLARAMGFPLAQFQSPRSHAARSERHHVRHLRQRRVCPGCPHRSRTLAS